MDGRVAVVTGAGRGMGRAIAERLQATGMRVVWADLAPEVVELAGTAAGPGEGLGQVVDVADAESVERLFEQAVAAFGRVEVLVNCAGAIRLAPIEEIDETEWDRIVDVNLKGVYLCCRAALRSMGSGGQGRIVNIASDVGKRGESNMVHYVAAKFGVVGLTQALALELADRGITVNAVCPSVTDTEMLRVVVDDLARIQGADPAAVLAELTAEVPAGRLARVDDIASAVEFLLSPGAEFLTGQALNVSGGRIMQ